MKGTVSVQGNEIDIRDLMNPPGMFHDGTRQRQYSAKDCCPTSGRLLPEFDRRRSIKDMFVRKPLPTRPESASNSNGFDGVSAIASISPNDAQEHQSDVQKGSALHDSTALSADVVTIPSTGAASPSKKRHAPAASLTKPVKKTKSNASIQNDTTQLPLKGQQSLKGFFKPKPASEFSHSSSRSRQSNQAVCPEEPGVDDDDDANCASGMDETPTQTSNALLQAASVESNLVHDASSDFSSAKLNEPIDDDLTKTTWKSLFTKPAAPRCEGHGEPCRSYVTKKKGFHTGRSFWICARPLGPSGNKEKGTQWRCHTFIWASDWNGNGG